MRASTSIVLLSGLLSAFIGPLLAGAERYAVGPRQGSHSSPSITSASLSSSFPTNGPSQSSSTMQVAATSLTSSTTDTDGSSSMKQASSMASSPSASTAIASASVSASPSKGITTSSTPAIKSTTNSISGALPLRPIITPALAIAGVLLMTSGVTYALVGIKDKRLQIFLSAFYLTSLATIVLIVYVMNPPVTNAVQGAYFVAASVVGLIFGVGSLIFTEITEGLGCLLGGFCLSMWFLVLKSGGLLTSSEAKIIFISAFTVAAFALSFSRYTRPYGLIGCTSFAGATAIVLGMDCFSRAGLKEFWLYIWNLNNNLFPLNTTTYPITRGIRVEIACIVLIFFVGIMSQMKLWKVIKARRDNKELLHLQDEERRNQAEEDLGRRLEEGNEIEREQWEAIYGNKELAARQLTDSSIGTDGIESVRKESTSAFTAREVQDSPTEIIEMHELEPLVAFSQDESNRGKGIEKSRIIVRVANDEETSPEPVVDQSDCLSQVSASTRVSEQSVETAHQDSASPQPADKEKLTETQLAANPVPDIIPLPFNVPVVHRGNNKDLISSATFAASDDHRLPLSQRFSTSTSRRVRSRGSQHNSTIPSISQEALLIAHSDDDQDSSAAATVDDFAYDSDVKARDMISVPRSDSHGAVSSISAAELEQPENSQLFESDDITEQHYNAQAAKLSSQSSSKITAQVLVSPSSPDDAVESWEGSVSAGGRPVIEEQRTYDEVFPVRASVSDANEAHATNDSMTTSEDSKKAPSNSNLYGRLPEHTSKVVTAYRTNEWAKHLDRAQKPELDELGTSNNPQASGLTLVEEAPAPVYISELQQTGFDGGQLKRSSQTPSRHSNRIAPKQRAWFAASEDPSQQSQGNPGQSNLSPRVERSPSQVSLSGTSAKNAMPLSVLTKPGTHHSSTPTGRGLRSSSTPLVSRTSIESPIEEDVEASFPPRSTLTMIPTNTLIAKRENMARSRFSSLTVNQLQHSPPSSTPNSRSRSPSLDDDNISLSHRKSLLHQNQQHRQSSLPTQLPQQPPGDSRSSLLATWRDSVAQNLNATHQPDQEAETRRREMLDEKHRSRINQHQATVATNRKGTMVEQAMRRGSMLDAHREAMRRMQGVANRGL